MIVTSHRSPLPRIDYAAKPRAENSEPAEALNPAEYDRIWKLVRQTAEGTCGVVEVVEQS